MLNSHKKIFTDETMRPLAVQIDYKDWLEIERLLIKPTESQEEGEPAKDLHNSPLFGLWRDREDCQDVQEFVDELRQGRF